MSKHSRFIKQWLGGLVIALSAGQAMAGYSQVIAFGDSLSDTGNFHALTSGLPGGGIPGVPYDDGRFSNGALAVEVMAQALGTSLKNFAVAGATTGQGNQFGSAFAGTGVAGQVAKYTVELNGQAADAQALYFVWAGANDLLSGDMSSPNTASTAASNMLGSIMELNLMGAQDFLVPLMPDLSLTPGLKAIGGSYLADAHQRSVEYNNLITSGMSFLMSITPGLHVTVFDTTQFLSDQAANFANAGVDTKHACYNPVSGHVCPHPEKYAFWDPMHPSAYMHDVLGKAFAGAVDSSLSPVVVGPTTGNVPEPDAIVLVCFGVIAVGWHQRRRRAQA